MSFEQTSSAAIEVETELAPLEDADTRGDGRNVVSARAGRRVRRWVAHRVLRLLMILHRGALVLATTIARRHSCKPGEILVTGTFYSDNWVRAHLRPLSASRACSQVWVVSTYPIPEMPNVTPIYPPRWLVRLTSDVPARLFTFAWVALRKRPQFVGGFHLLVNGLLAAVVARLVGAYSIYFCVGGPMEVIDGGIWAENRIFGKLETPDAVVERHLIQAVGAFDLVITMGTRAVTFFRDRGVRTQFHVVPGGIDSEQFQPVNANRDIDLILVGRLARVKRIDVFLHAAKLVADAVPDINVTIIGDGELREALETQARALGLEQRVTFLGHQRDVGHWLRRSRIFVLTSDSEGLALSLMEAMMCGLTAVVTDVGDLADLVEDGVNGYLVETRSPSLIAARIIELLRNEERLQSFSRAARRAAQQYDTARIAEEWTTILENTTARVHVEGNA